MMPDIHSVLKLFRDRGDSGYGGEAVTQMEHALQCALLAEQHNASPALISAALLHDIGHLLHTLPDDAPGDGIDDAHESLGHCYLEKVFGPAVSEPVRLHVAAKRYLCATFREYHDQLSQPSRISLELQGGTMSDREAAEFRDNPFADDAVRLRRWDDTAKDPDLPTPPLAHFVPYLQAVVDAGSAD